MDIKGKIFEAGLKLGMFRTQTPSSADCAMSSLDAFFRLKNIKLTRLFHFVGFKRVVTFVPNFKHFRNLHSWTVNDQVRLTENDKSADHHSFLILIVAEIYSLDQIKLNMPVKLFKTVRFQLMNFYSIKYLIAEYCQSQITGANVEINIVK